MAEKSKPKEKKKSHVKKTTKTKRKTSEKKEKKKSSTKHKKSTRKKTTKRKTVKKSTRSKTSDAKKSRIINEKEIAMDFATKVHQKFESLIKATILFGSQAKNRASAGSDVDIIIIIDDAAVDWDLELITWYREELAKMVSSSSYGKELHVNTIKLTTWWNDLMHGDPVVINVLRYGEALIDIAGFFNPIKALLIQGKIHSTPEAVYAALQRAPAHLARSKLAEMGAVEGIYWTMVDSAQAALITLGKLPPSPEHITPMLKTYFVDQGLLKADYVRWYRDVFALHKGITHGDIKDIKGVELDEWQERAEQFMLKMTQIIDQILESRKK